MLNQQSAVEVVDDTVGDLDDHEAALTGNGTSSMSVVTASYQR